MENTKIIGSKAYFLSTLLLAIITIYFTNLFVGQNDTITYIIFWTISLILTVIIYQLRTASRAVMAVYFKPGSFFHSFFTKDKFSLINLIISTIIAMPLSFIFILMAKGLILNYLAGYVTLALGISTVIYLYMTRNFYEQVESIVENNITESAQENSFNIISVFAISIIINIFISLFFSFSDYDDFKSNNTQFNYSLIEKMEKSPLEAIDENQINCHRINKNENEYTCNSNTALIASVYLMLGEIKPAIANQIWVFGFQCVKPVNENKSHQLVL